MPGVIVPIYQLIPQEKRDTQSVTYVRDDGDEDHFTLRSVGFSDDLSARLEPVARYWANRVREEEGSIYVPIGVGSEEASDDIYVICLLRGEAMSLFDLRCWPLNEFERLSDPSS